MSRKVLVPVADGSEELEAITIVDILRRAGAEVTLASAASLQVVCSRGTRLVADKRIKDCKDEVFDLIAVPGGMPGSERLRDSPELTALLQQQQAAGRFYAAICAAPIVVLQHHGLLQGHPATCHSSMAPRLDNYQTAQQDVVVDGPCITSRGVGTALTFALKLVEILFDAKTASDTAARLK